MTWQQIDENTYIDDTLVTCAEYQLFIDEMREEGKYYQPDHWIRDDFENGSAKLPITGVRSSDAVEFCGWLTKQGDRQWEFRLPTISEAKNNQLLNIASKPIGYWTINESLGNDFYWINKPERTFERPIIRPVDLGVRDPIQVIDGLATIDPFDGKNNRTHAQAIFLAQSRFRLIHPSYVNSFVASLAVDRKSRVDISLAHNIASRITSDLRIVTQYVFDDDIADVAKHQLEIAEKVVSGLAELKKRDRWSNGWEGIRLIKYHEPS